MRACLRALRSPVAKVTLARTHWTMGWRGQSRNPKWLVRTPAMERQRREDLGRGYRKWLRKENAANVGSLHHVGRKQPIRCRPSSVVGSAPVSAPALPLTRSSKQPFVSGHTVVASQREIGTRVTCDQELDDGERRAHAPTVGTVVWSGMVGRCVTRKAYDYLAPTVPDGSRPG